MNKIFRLQFLVLSIYLLPTISFAESVIAPVNLVSASGIGESIGEIKFEESAKGLRIIPNLKQLPPGQRAMHIHENPSCDAGVKDGTPTAALAAGAHYDPEHTGKHLGPDGGGHAGDLPYINVNASGEAKEPVTAPRLTLAQLHKHSIIIHENGDNYSDTPKPLGGAGGRIACGIIP